MASALGMIETIGLVSALTAADAGLKAANVRLLGTDYVHGGLVMVRLEGEVAAVQAAVDAGAQAGARVGKVFSAHVIPRAMPEVVSMLTSGERADPARPSAGGCASCGCCPGGQGAQPDANASTPNKQSITKCTTSTELENWKVLSLRQAVRKLPDFPLKPGEIRFANKQTLLKAIAAWQLKED